MAYEKTLWKDRVVEKPNTYRTVENPDGTITLYPITGQVIEKGTPISAANLNKIENGIVEVYKELETIVQKNNSIIINPKYPPPGYESCKMDGITDDTVAFQALIDNFSNIKLPAGTLRFSHLVLSSNTKITGLGINETFLKPLLSNNINAITLSTGPNVGIFLDNFTLIGNDNNRNQNGLYCNATPSTEQPYHGGLWLSKFSNLVIKNFGGVQFILSGGSNGLLPHQGLVFERLECSAKKGVATSRALIVQGQTEQTLWLQCAFSGEGSDIVSEFITTIDGDIGGGSQTFLQCYFGNGKTGIKLERSKYIKFTNCYYENLEVGHTSNKSCEHIIFENGNYQLVKICHNGLDSSSQIIIEKNILVGTSILIDGWGIFTHNNNYGCSVVTNEKRDVSIIDKTLNITSKYTRVNGESRLSILNSLTCYDEILLIAWDTDGFSIDNTGNIDVREAISVKQFEVVKMKLISDKWIIENKFLY